MTDIEWERARVIRTPEGILCRDPHSGWWIGDHGDEWGTSDIDAMAWVVVVIDGLGRNAEARETWSNQQDLIDDALSRLDAANEAIARLVRERETAYRELRQLQAGRP